MGVLVFDTGVDLTAALPIRLTGRIPNHWKQHTCQFCGCRLEPKKSGFTYRCERSPVQFCEVCAVL